MCRRACLARKHKREVRQAHGNGAAGKWAWQTTWQARASTRSQASCAEEVEEAEEAEEVEEAEEAEEAEAVEAAEEAD